MAAFTSSSPDAHTSLRAVPVVTARSACSCRPSPPSTIALAARASAAVLELGSRSRPLTWSFWRRRACTIVTPLSPIPHTTECPLRLRARTRARCSAKSTHKQPAGDREGDDGGAPLGDLQRRPVPRVAGEPAREELERIQERQRSRLVPVRVRLRLGRVVRVGRKAQAQQRQARERHDPDEAAVLVPRGPPKLLRAAPRELRQPDGRVLVGQFRGGGRACSDGFRLARDVLDPIRLAHTPPVTSSFAEQAPHHVIAPEPAKEQRYPGSAVRRWLSSRLARPLLLATALLGIAAGGRASAWQQHAALPEPRSEVAAAAAGGEIVVVGGFVESGANSSRVDAYSVEYDSWRRLPDLPITVDHASAAGVDGRVYVAGGYGADRRPSRSVFVLDGGAWRRLAALPDGRAAAAAAIAGGRLYVVGGRNGRRLLARDAFALTLGSKRWERIRGPRPREHLAAASSGGRVYAVGGRAAGIDTNETAFEVYDRAASAGSGSPRCRARAAAPARPRWAGASSRSAARSRPARSAACTRTPSRRAAGRGSPTSHPAPWPRRRRPGRPCVGGRGRPRARVDRQRRGRVAEAVAAASSTSPAPSSAAWASPSGASVRQKWKSSAARAAASTRSRRRPRARAAASGPRGRRRDRRRGRARSARRSAGTSCMSRRTFAVIGSVSRYQA